MSASWIWRRLRRDARSYPGRCTALVAGFFLLALLAGAALLGTRAAGGLAAAAAENVHVIAYLDESTDQEGVAEVTQALRQVRGVRFVREVSSDEALSRLRAAAASLGNTGAALGGLEPGFLPQSLEVALVPGHDLPVRAAELRKRLRDVPGVTEVDAMTEGLTRLETWTAVGSWLTRALVLFAALAAFAAIALATRLGRAARRERAETLWFLGETRARIRVPDMLVVAMAAIAGTLLGALVLRLAFPAALVALENASGLVAGTPPHLLTRELWLGLGGALLLGAVLGAAGVPLPRERQRA